MKKIAVQRDLTDIIEGLTAMGYDVVAHDRITGPIDAYIYHEEINTRSFIEMNEWLSLTLSNNSHTNGTGTLLINAKNKSVEDISSMINQRTYTPLFQSEPYKGLN